MPEFHLKPISKSDNTDNFTDVSWVRECNQLRSVNLFIDPKEDHFRLKVQGAEDLFDSLEENWEDDIPLKSTELWGAVQTCRKVWCQEAVDLKHGGVLIFQNQWNFSKDQTILNQLLPKLAIAGSRLFEKIFFPKGDETKNGKLRKIGNILRENTLRKRMWIRVTSDSFYAPWNLIYALELKDRIAGSDARKEGFWGYQHLVEHVPSYGVGSQRFMPQSPLQVAVHLDENIDKTYNVSCNAEVMAQMNLYDNKGLHLEERPKRDILAEALRQTALLDDVIYFCCHAVVEGDDTKPRIDESYFALTDRDKHITSDEIAFWMGRNKFSHFPIVFLNACQTGQMNSMFYQGFARMFLDRQASTVIGTQTEIPAIFAGQFARSFFDKFFEGGETRDADGKPMNKVGKILYNLRRRFVDEFNNPLGLLYCVYRGADIFLPKAVVKKTDAPQRL